MFFGVFFIVFKFCEEVYRVVYELNDIGFSEDVKDYFDGSYGSVIIFEEIL